MYIEGLSGGCICCKGSGDFGRTVDEVIQWTSPDKIYIEPSVPVRLSAVLDSLDKSSVKDRMTLGPVITVVDGKKFRICLQNFGDFYKNQIVSADMIRLNNTGYMTEETLDQCRSEIRKLNPTAKISINRN